MASMNRRVRSLICVFIAIAMLAVGSICVCASAGPSRIAGSSCCAIRLRTCCDQVPPAQPGRSTEHGAHREACPHCSGAFALGSSPATGSMHLAAQPMLAILLSQPELRSEPGGVGPAVDLATRSPSASPATLFGLRCSLRL